MKVLVKSVILVLISFTIIYFMSKHNFLQIDSLKDAFIKHKKIIYSIFFLQILSCFFMTLRYFSLLKMFKINVDFKNVTAATFVSNSLGLWMPGSMAFIEIIRIGLMIGAQHKLSLAPPLQTSKIEADFQNNKKQIAEDREQLSFRARLTAVSLFDRLIGLWAMLFIGIFFTGSVIIYNYKYFSGNYEGIGLFSIFILTLFLLILITFLPYVSKKIMFRKIVTHFERVFLTIFKHNLLNKILKKIFFEVNSILDAIAIGGKNLHNFLMPVFYSFMCVFIQALATYYSAIAISAFIPFSAILATISILAIATLLPISFGGIGGVQFIAAISMSFFGVVPHNAASAQLLQAAINILAISFVGLFFSKLTLKQIKSALKLYGIKKI